MTKTHIRGNKIRNELIPYLEKNYNPRIKETLRRFAALHIWMTAFLRDCLVEYLEQYGGDDDEKSISLGAYSRTIRLRLTAG